MKPVKPTEKKAKPFIGIASAWYSEKSLPKKKASPVSVKGWEEKIAKILNWEMAVTTLYDDEGREATERMKKIRVLIRHLLSEVRKDAYIEFVKGTKDFVNDAIEQARREMLSEIKRRLPKEKLVLIEHKIKEDLTTPHGVALDAAERVEKMVAERWATFYYNKCRDEVLKLLEDFGKWVI